MNKFRTPFNLPTRFEFESGLHIENEFLFGIYESLFSDSPSLKKDLSRYYSEAKSQGFPNHIVESVPEKELSHDQMTAYSCYSLMNGLDGHLRIYQKIKKGKVDGTMLHPRDLLYFGLVNGNILATLFAPLLWILCAFSMLIPYRITIDETDRPNQILRIGKFLIRDKLSGELLWVLRLEAAEQRLIPRILLYPCKLLVLLGAKFRFGSIEQMFIKYFLEDPEHPIVKVLINR